MQWDNTMVQPHLVIINKALIHVINRSREIIQHVLLEFNTLFIESAVADPEGKGGGGVGSQRPPPIFRVPPLVHFIKNR